MLFSRKKLSFELYWNFFHLGRYRSCELWPNSDKDSCLFQHSNSEFKLATEIGIMINKHEFYSEIWTIFVLVLWKRTKINQKEAGFGPFLKKNKQARGKAYTRFGLQLAKMEQQLRKMIAERSSFLSASSDRNEKPKSWFGCQNSALLLGTSDAYFHLVTRTFTANNKSCKCTSLLSIFTRSIWKVGLFKSCLLFAAITKHSRLLLLNRHQTGCARCLYLTYLRVISAFKVDIHRQYTCKLLNRKSF